MKNNIDIHADDFGFTINTSKDIIDCIKSGNLNSFSIIPNMSCFEECIGMLYKEIPTFSYLPKISVHLNYVEGLCLSDTGLNNYSWGRILLLSLTPKRRELKDYLKKETIEQIKRVDEVVSKCIEIANKNYVVVNQKGIRIDSHTHTHSIPLVFKTIEEVIIENNLNVEYIRNPKEPIIPFIKNINLDFRSINFVKNIILNIFSHRIDRYCDRHNMQKEYMWGLVMSGEMDFKRIKTIIPDMKNKANKNKRDLEILFHPGLALESENIEEINPNNYKNFNSSSNRHIEKEAIMNINKII